MAKAADEFLQRCVDSEKLPDVFEFLAQHEGLSERSQLEVLLVDQFQRWKHNQVIPVDQYLDRAPEIRDVLKVELLLEEYGYLEERGIAPSSEEFAGRYSRLEPEALQELCNGLDIEQPSMPGSGSGTSRGDATGSASHAAPASIGRYQVIRLLGKGTFGKVYLAKDPDLDRSVAIKVPTSQRIEMGGGVEEFLKEARAVAKLDHPNIVPVFDCGITEDGQCFVVSKYVRGKELRSEIRKGVSHHDAAQIVCQLARALHVAHVAGIVHRDVKPGNIMIDAKRQPHLLDFGLAIQEQDSAENETLVGTPAYMSPEQAEGGSHRVDGRSDIYSLAVVFYEMLTGHRPFRSDKAEEILAQLKMGEVRPPRQSDDTIPVMLEEICLKALSKRLSDRYSTAKDMADDLEDWLIMASSEEGSSISRSGEFGATRSSRRSSLATTSSSESGWLRFVKSPATLIVSSILVCFVLVLLFSEPPWNRKSLNGDESVSSTNQDNQKDPDSDLATGADRRPQRVAVLGFRDLSGSSEGGWLSTALMELITDELAKSQRLRMVSCENVELMKVDLDLSNAEVLGSSALERIRKRLDVDWVVLGSYELPAIENEKLRLTVTLQATDAAGGKSQFEHSVEEQEWLELVTSSSAQLRQELQVSPPSIVETGQLFPSAPNAKAVEDYFRGVSLFRRFDLLAAREAFLKAASLDPSSALIHDSIAQTENQLGNENAARDHATKAVDCASSLPKNLQLEIQGRHHLLAGEPMKAVAEYRQLFEMRNGDLEERLLLAEALISGGQGWKALDLLAEARKDPHNDAAKARIELVSSRAAQAVSEFPKQLEFASSAATAAAQVGARLLEGHSKLSEGQALRRIGNHAKAVICFDLAVKLFKEHGDQRSAAVALAAWGKALVDHGQLDQAEAKINEGLELGKELGNERLIARLTGQLGEVSIYRGQFPKAEELLTESLESFRKLGDRQGIADMNLTLANVMARTGKPTRAMEMVAEARKAFQASGDRRGEGRTWGQQGAMLGRQGNVIEAQRHFERALELFREVGDRRGIATCLGDLATTNSNQGKLTKAGELYAEALEILRQLKSRRGPEMVMFNLSNLYARTGRLEEAESLMSESLRRYKDQSKWMNACFVERKLADIQLLRGRLADARKTVDTALAKSREVGSLAVEAQSLATLSDIALFEGDLAAAKKHIIESRQLSAKLKQELNVAACDLTLARIAFRDGKRDEASQHFEKAVSIIAGGKPEFKSMVLFFQTRLEAADEKQSIAENTFAKADAAILENPTEDVGVRLRCQLEKARALVAISRVPQAVEIFENIARKAAEFGWPALAMEAGIDRLEAIAGSGEETSQKELASLFEEASKFGFLDFANRAKKLLDQEKGKIE